MDGWPSGHILWRLERDTLHLLCYNRVIIKVSNRGYAAVKRKTAKEILAESFRELAESKTVDAITVREITENCGYSTATFYRQFKDKYDLIAWEHARRVEGIMDRIGVDGFTWRQTLLEGALMFDRERDYLANLLCHTSGYDSFVRYKTEINYEALKRHILKSSGKAALEETLDMYVRAYVLGTVGLTCEWILGRYAVGPEELAEVFEKSLPQPLYEFLL